MVEFGNARKPSALRNDETDDLFAAGGEYLRPEYIDEATQEYGEGQAGLLGEHLKCGEHRRHRTSDHLLEQILFVFEGEIDGAFGHAGLFGDLVEARCGVAIGGKDVERHIEDGLAALLRRLSAAFGGIGR